MAIQETGQGGAAASDFAPAADGFIRNRWYVAARSGDVGRRPHRVRILGESIVLYRKQSAEVVVLQDRCPHRHAPLSLGTVIGDEIQCRYHGFQFESSGRCTKIPGEKVIPGAVRVSAVPAVESFGLVWVWPGDAAKADPALLPLFPWASDPRFQSYIPLTLVDAPFALAVDNLMDLTHVHFTHRLLGVDNLIHESEPMQTWEEGEHIHYKRELRQGIFAGTGTYVEIHGEFIPPSLVVTSSMPRRESGEELTSASTVHVLHCLTPMTAQSTLYLLVRCWTNLARPHEIASIHHQVDVTLAEDKEIVEAQYHNRLASASLPDEALIRADRAAVLARRSYDKILQSERVRQDVSAVGSVASERVVP